MSRPDSTAHEVNLISVVIHPGRGVLLHLGAGDRWGFPGSEDLAPGETWEEAQARGLASDLGPVRAENLSVLHMESFPAGTVGPRAKFGVFMLTRTEPVPEGSASSRWVMSAADLEDLPLLHPRVADLVRRALASL